ncbi:hypothetical protein THAOC_21815, partial [Thalassiosira oceanica]
PRLGPDRLPRLVGDHGPLAGVRRPDRGGVRGARTALPPPGPATDLPPAGRREERRRRRCRGGGEGSRVRGGDVEDVRAEVRGGHVPHTRGVPRGHMELVILF